MTCTRGAFAEYSIHEAVARMNVRLDSTRMRTPVGDGIAAIPSTRFAHGGGGHTACFVSGRTHNEGVLK